MSLDPVAATPGSWLATTNYGHRYVLPGDGCPDAQAGTALVTSDDQGVPWLVFPGLGEQCPISQQIEGQ